MNRVIASSEVSRFDNKASKIVQELFEAYYGSPSILPNSPLRRLAIMERAYNLPNPIDISNCNSGVAEKEVARIHDADPAALCLEDVGEYGVKKNLLARVFVDHISGMTDSYALQEHRSIYGSTSG